jgi:hypothetical protein
LFRGNFPDVVRNDPLIDSQTLLRDFITEKDELKADAYLDRIVTLVIDPVATRTLQKQLMLRVVSDAESSRGQDALELLGDVKVAIVDQLLRIRSSKDVDARSFESLEAYTVTVVKNACREYYRRRYPRRFRLSNQLRYVLSKDDRLRLVQHEAGKWICGTAQAMRVSPLSLNGSSGADPATTLRHFLSAVDKQASLARRVFSVLQAVGVPVPLEQLIAAFYEIDQIVEPDEIPIEESVPIRFSSTSVLADSDRRALLAAVWEELSELPLPHRRALLLHLSDDSGDNLLLLFPIDGIASIRMIAEKIEMPAAHLAAIWNRLPLPDKEIAALLGLERQQVINLRQSARKSLRRRLAEKGFLEKL